MKILVTGATGYFGNRLANTLASQGHEVRVLARKIEAARNILHPSIGVYQGDILDKKSIENALVGCNWVFHAAAFVGLWAPNRSEIFDVNVTGTQNLLELSLEYGIKKFIFTSTCGTIGASINKPLRESDPRVTPFTNDYDLSKFIAEKKVKGFADRGLDAVIVNASKIFGPSNVVQPIGINNIIDRFINGKITFCPSPATLQSNYVFIDDLVRGHLLAGEKGEAGENYIIGGYNRSFHDFFKAITTVTGNKGKLVAAPRVIAKIYGTIYFTTSRLKGDRPVFSGRHTDAIYCNKMYNMDKAKADLGYSPLPFHDALAKTILFLRAGKEGTKKDHFNSLTENNTTVQSIF